MRFSACFLSALFIFCSVQTAKASYWEQILINGETRLEVEVVVSAAEQHLGLGNRFSLPQGTGMLFLYQKPGKRTFWMKNMRFPLDIIWFNSGVAVHIERDVPPPAPGTADQLLKIYGGSIVSDMVLEVPAGYAKRHSILPGSRVQIIQK